jgi:hypothetical protein
METNLEQVKLNVRIVLCTVLPEDDQEQVP